MKEITFIGCIFIASLLLYSCEDYLHDEMNTTTITEEQIDQNIKNISIVLANAVSINNELVKEIEKEISYRFDYDNDALIKVFLNREIGDKKFEDILSKSSDGRYSPKDIKKMILESGYLQFTFPQNYKSFDYESVKPLVVPVYSFINEQDTEFLEAFDKDGKTVNLSAKEMPGVPVIVVGRSERVDEEGYMSVSERSVVLPKELRKMHYTEAVDLARNPLKSAKPYNHIVTILSQDEFDMLGGDVMCELTSDFEVNLKSVNSSDSELTVRSDNPKQHKLNWSPFSNGTYTSNKYQIFRDDMGQTPIVTIIDANSYIDNVPIANYSYEYYIKCYYDNIYLGQSNWYKLQSSHRRSGGQEYIDNLYASHQMVVSLEGWWVSELEIDWHIIAGNYDGTSSELTPGGTHFQCAKDASGEWITPRYVSVNDDVNLFLWNKTETYGSYTVYFRESDNNTNTEMWEASIQIVAKAVSYIWGDNKLIKAIAEDIVDPIIKLIQAYKNDDKIGEVHITWSTPNGIVQEIGGNGFKVTINQKN